MSRPNIGISLGFESNEPHCYVSAVDKAGGTPLAFVPTQPQHVGALLDRIDGLVLAGGADIDPALYGEQRRPEVKRVARDRDDFEIALCRGALDRRLPLLAICRGQQVLNVATGGTLIQDLPSQWKGVVDHDPDVDRWALAHDVEVVGGTRLREILGQGRITVNSFHHQAVKELGQGVSISARSIPDGVIEGIEVPEARFAVGVQWHPEAFWDHGTAFQTLFEALVRTAAQR